jgi:signal transduction histidine kinase
VVARQQCGDAGHAQRQHRQIVRRLGVEREEDWPRQRVPAHALVRVLRTADGLVERPLRFPVGCARIRRMDLHQTDRHWARLVRSGTYDMKTPFSVALGSSGMMGREPVTERQAKFLEEIQRALGRMHQTMERMEKLALWSEGRIDPVKVEVVELGALVREVAEGFTVRESDPPLEVRMGADAHNVRANRRDLAALIGSVIFCVWVALNRGSTVGRTAVWVTEPQVGSIGECWVVIAAPDQLERAMDPDNLVTFTDDRAGFIQALNIAVASRLVTAAGGRMLCFREKVPGAVIAVPRD